MALFGSDNKENNQETLSEIAEQIKILSEKNAQIDITLFDRIHEDLVRINEEQKVANKQAMINNALQLLDTQSNTNDAILSVDEIKQYYRVIIDELFDNTKPLNEVMKETE